MSSGLPWIRWIRPKATIETPNKIRTVCSRRSRMNRAMAMKPEQAVCPRRLVDDDGMSLSQQLDLLLGIETLLRLREQALDPRVGVMAPVDAVWREACFAEITEHRCRVAEAETVVQRVDRVRDRRRRCSSLDDEHGSPVDDVEIELEPDRLDLLLQDLVHRQWHHLPRA